MDAFTQWQELSWSDEQYFTHEGRLKRILDEEAAVYNSRKATAKVLTIGVALDLVIEASQLTYEKVLNIQQEME